MRREALIWVLQRASGAILLAGLALHFYIMHFAGEGRISHEAIASRLSEPGWIAFNLAFLLSAAYHGFSGLWGIALEYLRGGVLKAAYAAIWISAFGVAGAGIYILTLG